MFCCEKCNQKIETKSELIICNGVCRRGFHRSCTTLDCEKLKYKDELNNLAWKCAICVALDSRNLLKHANVIADSVEAGRFNELNKARISTTHANAMSIESQLKKDIDAENPQSFTLKRKSIIFTATVVVLIALMGITIFLLSLQSGDEFSNRRNISQLYIITRAEWQAQPSAGVLDSLELPVHSVIISHMATKPCELRRVCDERVRTIQSFHTESMEWHDIGSNFLIGGDGLVYEGRGWNYQGAHTKGFNKDSIGVSFIGTFSQTKPSGNQIKALELLLEEGIRLRKIVPNYKLYGARQFGVANSPGDALYDIIKRMPHWVDEDKTGSVLTIIPRDSWLAEPSRKRSEVFSKPAARVITTILPVNYCKTMAACTYHVRLLQNLNIEVFGYDDIIYNFLIGGDGCVYEGLGWDYDTKPILENNQIPSLSVAYIGNHGEKGPTKLQTYLTGLLLEEGVRLKKLAPFYEIVEAHDLEPDWETTQKQEQHTLGELTA